MCKLCERTWLGGIYNKNNTKWAFKHLIEFSKRFEKGILTGFNPYYDPSQLKLKRHISYNYKEDSLKRYRA